MKHRTWFKTYQDRLLSDPEYLALSPAARGVLADLRCFASRTADHGRTGHTSKTLLRWYGGNRDAVKTALKSLGNRRLIAVEPDTETLRIPNWDESQETLKAAMMRRLRAQAGQRAGGNNAATIPVTVTPQTEAEADPPTPLLEVPHEIEELAFRIFGHAPLANLSEWIGLHGAETVKAALLATEKNNVRSPAYTTKILHSWAQSGRPKDSGSNGHQAPEKVKLYDPENAFDD
jgi:hypothetical protein